MKLVVGGKEKGQMERNETTLQSRFGQEVRKRAASSRQGLSRSESPVGGKDAASNAKGERTQRLVSTDGNVADKRPNVENQQCGFWPWASVLSTPALAH